MLALKQLRDARESNLTIDRTMSNSKEVTLVIVRYSGAFVQSSVKFSRERWSIYPSSLWKIAFMNVSLEKPLRYKRFKLSN